MDKKHINEGMKSRFAFFKKFLKQPKDIGSITPSSQFLCKKMTEPLKASHPHVVVELGAGDGRMTKHILKNVPKTCKVIAIEKQAEFVEELQKIKDSRLVVVSASAENLVKTLQKNGLDEADYVISGLPLANIDRAAEEKILKNIYTCLKPGGRYMQYHYLRPYNFSRYKNIFQSLKLDFILFNLPPSFVYTCQK